MASLMVDFIISLDGYASADGWPGLWGMDVPEYLAFVEEGAENEHVALMGATTYRLMSGFATEMPDDPGVAALTALPKVVFSSTLEAPLSWPNTELVDGDAVEAAKEMKRSDPRPLRTIGSLSVCRSLLRAGVVDRFRVVVFPVITGATGKERIFDGYPDIALELVESRTFDGRLQLLEYVPSVLDGPPGVGDYAGVTKKGTETMKLTTTTMITVDGVMQGLGGPDEDRRGGFERGGWVAPFFGDEAGVFLNQTYQRADAFLFGRRTYEIFAGSWGTWDDPGDNPIWTALNTKPKYVASTTITETQWADTTVVSGDLAAAVGELKAKPEGELQVHGSGNLIRWLLANDLVDEMNLLTVPVVVGQGTRLFPDTGPDVALELVESRPSPGG